MVWLRFNPSVEGQPLQHGEFMVETANSYYGFNPSVEGQPLQLKNFNSDTFEHPVGFNPSVEGQPLQPISFGIIHGTEAGVFQSLCRGTAIATFLNDAMDSGDDYQMFQSLCRGTAIATHKIVVQTL